MAGCGTPRHSRGGYQYITVIASGKSGSLDWCTTDVRWRPEAVVRTPRTAMPKQTHHRAQHFAHGASLMRPMLAAHEDIGNSGAMARTSAQRPGWMGQRSRGTFV